MTLACERVTSGLLSLLPSSSSSADHIQMHDPEGVQSVGDLTMGRQMEAGQEGKLAVEPPPRHAQPAGRSRCHTHRRAAVALL
jgi:hypothetical protein